MECIKIKPLSVNRCWRGRRFKTDEYKWYEIEVLSLLGRIDLPPPPYTVNYEFGVSNRAMDIDNPIKPFTDILQKRYGFNDRDIYEMNVKKVKVKKGAEYIKFEIKRK